MRSFNFDVLHAVARVLDRDTLASLAQTCRLFNEAATPHLYKSITIRIRNIADKDPDIFDTFTQHPDLKLYVHRVEQIGPESYNNTEASTCDPSKEVWTHFLASLPNLREYSLTPWSHLGFISIIRVHAALAALRRSGVRLRAVSLPYEGRFSTFVLGFCLTSLVRLRLVTTWMEPFSDDKCALVECCRKCPNLEHVELVGLRPKLFEPTSELNLTSFTLGPRYTAFQIEDIVSILQHMPRLRHLDLFIYPAMLSSPNHERTFKGFLHLRTLTVRYFLNRVQTDATETESQIAMFDWIILLLARSSPELLAVLSSDRSGCSGDALVSRFAARTVRELRCLTIPYLSCSAPIVRTLLAFCPHLEELSLAVTSVESAAMFREARFLHTPPLRNLTLHVWIPRAQAQVHDTFARRLIEERAPTLAVFVINGKRKWEVRWVSDSTSNEFGAIRREIIGPIFL